MLQEECFRYYYESAHPDSGTTLENIPGDDRIVATGASGFGIMALIVGVDRGFITRDEGLARMQKIVAFLEKAPRYHGVWSHFMDGHTGASLPVFSMFDNAGDLVETAFLMEGLLAARQYFHGDNSAERDLYDRITQLWNTVEWDWYRRTPDGDALFWHWSPEFAWHINHRITGYNEAMIIYLLAIASPKHSVPAEFYYSGWAGRSAAAVNYRRGWSGVTTPRNSKSATVTTKGKEQVSECACKFCDEESECSEREGEITCDRGRRISQWPFVLRDQVGCWSRKRRSAVFHALFVYGIRSARTARSLH